jgi:hypothetical protein
LYIFIVVFVLCFIVLYLEFYYTYNISLKMDFLRRATTPAVTSVAGLFGFFSSEPPLQDTKTEENRDDTKIQTIANTAAEKTANAAELNRTLTKCLNNTTEPKLSDEYIRLTKHRVMGATLAAINANLALDNALSEEKPSDELNAANLKIENDTLMQESLQAFIAAQQNITEFRKQCVDEAIKQFQEALGAYGIQVNPKISGAIMGQIAGSWSELLISSTQGDSSIYLSYKTFFFRVNQAIDALLTQCIFLSTKWTQSFPPSSSPPASESYPKVKVGPCWYTIGPILDFQNIEGRIFIYVKCYHDATNGIYFWVYGSQSEGFNRVFFKLDPFGSIEKGFDYTQGTFVHLGLQMALCDYYKTHRSKPPKLLDTLTELNLFMSSMPYLQQAREEKDVHVHHRYMIDDSFTSIIKRGFPLHPPLPNPTTIHSDWLHVVNMIYKKRGYVSRENLLKIAGELQEQWLSECDKYFPDNNTHPHYEFSRRRMGYGTTCPYIFCFTTCGLVQSCPMFKLFLSANSYKNTFWCQGFQNYTEMLRNAGLSEGEAPPNRKILSPVLYVVIGALLQDPDMRLSTLRNIILNIGIMSDARTISQEYNEATKTFMTLGTGPKFQEPNTSLYLPNIPIRSAALLAFKNIRDKTNEIYESFKKKNSSPSEEDKKIVHLEVQKKIIMIKILAARFLGQPPPPPLPPPLPAKMTLFSREMQKLCRFKMDEYNVAIQNAATESTIEKFRTSISTSDVNVFTSEKYVFTSEKYYTDAQTNATKFIEASPQAAAAALFGYIYNPTDFVKELTHFALLCLKKEWIRGMMDDAYHALQGVFNRDNAIYNYLGIDGIFYEFDPAAPPPLPTPPTPPPPPLPTPPPLPYVLISSFDEVRKEDTSPTNPDKTELNVTVVTFAHIYRVDCGYHEIFADDSNVFKSMSIIYQISTTVVYTRVQPIRILYAVTHRTPLVCLPDLPDALDYLRRKFSKPPVKFSQVSQGGMPKLEKKGSIQPKAGKAAAAALASAAAAAAAEAAGIQQINSASHKAAAAAAAAEAAARKAAALKAAAAEAAGIQQIKKNQAAAAEAAAAEAAARKAAAAAEAAARKAAARKAAAQKAAARKAAAAQKAAEQQQLKNAAKQAKEEAPLKKFIAEQNLFIEERDHPLTSPYTLLATYNRVASYGALFAGKMMEYFFGGENGYYQLPYFFKNFDKFLKVCHQYDSTALMYLPNVPPYDLLVHHPSALELLPQSIESYFTTLDINFNGLVSDVDHKTYIQTKLNEYAPHIQAISEYLTKDFMPKPIDSGSSTQGSSTQDSLTSVSTASSTSSIASIASTASTASTASRRDEVLEKLLPYFGDIEDIDENIKYLNSILFGLPLPEEDDSDSDWSPRLQSLGSQDSLQFSQDSLQFSQGGTLPIKYHIKKSITTRKNKNKNKPRTKSKTPARRITIRIKRMMKSKVTKPKTYKRRATGGKRKSKPNKTMRRYRRVRK